MGNERVYAQLTGGNKGAEFAQLFSRVGVRVRLTKPKAADINAVAAAWDVSGKPQQAALRNIGARNGALRGVVKTLGQAAMMRSGSMSELTEEDILNAWKKYGGAADE